MILLPYENSRVAHLIGIHNGHHEHRARHATVHGVIPDSVAYCQHLGFKIVGPSPNNKRAFIERVTEGGNERIEIVAREIPPHEAWAFQKKDDLIAASSRFLREAHENLSFREFTTLRVEDDSTLAIMFEVCDGNEKPLSRYFQLIWRDKYFFKNVFAQ